MNSADTTAQGKSKDNPKASARPPGTRLVWGGAIAFAAVLASWIVFLVVSGRAGALDMVDLTVYRDGGLIVRHVTPYYDGTVRPALQLGRLQLAVAEVHLHPVRGDRLRAGLVHPDDAA